MRLRAFNAMLAACVAVAACGGAVANGPASASRSPSVSSSPGQEGPAPAASSAAAAVAPGAPSASVVPPPVEMKEPVATVMLAELQAIGLDPKHLPPIEKLEPRALRRTMKLLAKALGVKCTDCHLEGDFAATTRRKKIAAKMWDEFAAKLSFSDDSPLFCDSCHQGRVVQLDRRDKKALARWMDGAFVDKLKRKDGQDHGCETCHVDMEMKFLDQWAR